MMSEINKPPAPLRNTQSYRSWPERQAEKLAAQEAERQALSQRIQASRENGGVDELERARRRHVADIEAFRSLMAAAVGGPSFAKPPGTTQRAFMSAVNILLCLLAQRPHQGPTLVYPPPPKKPRFAHSMIL